MVTTLIVSNDFPPRVGGIESFVANLCTMLDQDVVVYTSGPAGAAASDAARGFPVIRDGALLLPTPRVRERSVELLTAYGCTRVIFGAAAPLGLLAPALRRAGAEAILGLTHGHEIWWSAVLGARQLLRRIGNGCDHVSTISDYATRRIAPALSVGARQQLIRLAPPVDTSTFRPPNSRPDVAPTTPRRRCVAVGRFVEQKGFRTLLRAWRLVLDRTPGDRSPELVLVGDGPQRRQLEQLISRLDLNRTVRLTGALPRDGVVCELQRSDVFALPVRTRLAGLNPEGLGLAALEAAACGLPVIVGRSGGAPETVQHESTGFVVSPDDPDELAARMRQLLDNPPLAQAMGVRGRVRVIEQFGLDRTRATLRAALALD